MCYPNQPEVSDLIHDLHVLNSLLQTEATWSSGRILADGITSGLWLNYVVRQFLCLQAIVESKDNDDTTGFVIREAFRLGALLYLAEIRRQFGVHPVRMQRYLMKLRALLENSDVAWGVFLPLKLWVLVVALIEAEADRDIDWLAHEVGTVALELHLRSKEALEDQLGQLFWYPEVYSGLLWCKLPAHTFLFSL